MNDLVLVQPTGPMGWMPPETVEGQIEDLRAEGLDAQISYDEIPGGGMELKRIREERGPSKGRLARMAGISRLTVFRIEYGRQRPRRSTVVKLTPEMFAGPANVSVELTQEIMDDALPYIREAARRLAVNGDDVEELVGAGLEGLYEACRKCDPSRGAPQDRYLR